MSGRHAMHELVADLQKHRSVPQDQSRHLTLNNSEYADKNGRELAIFEAHHMVLLP